jgi:Reverse transcriptase (RNA-dependent DNA polymerase)
VELRSGTYRPRPYRRREIPKGGGKVRVISIPAIRDRVVQGALRLILEPIFEADFSRHSFGARPRRSAHDAIGEVRSGLMYQKHLVLDVDLKSFFDDIRHAPVLARVARRVRDEQVLRLVKQFLSRSVLPSLYAQCSSPFALKPRPSLYCSDVTPLVRQPSTRSAHFCSVALMPSGMHKPVAPRKRGVSAARTTRRAAWNERSASCVSASSQAATSTISSRAIANCWSLISPRKGGGREMVPYEVTVTPLSSVAAPSLIRGRQQGVQGCGCDADRVQDSHVRKDAACAEFVDGCVGYAKQLGDFADGEQTMAVTWEPRGREQNRSKIFRNRSFWLQRTGNAIAETRMIF